MENKTSSKEDTNSLVREISHAGSAGTENDGSNAISHVISLMAT